MKKKSERVVGTIGKVVIAILLAAVIFVTMSVIFSGNKGYVPFFGYAYVSVQSRSMEGEKPEEYDEKPDGFSKGDLIRIRLLGKEERRNLAEGDIITFYMAVNGTRILNTHRIVGVGMVGEDRIVYTTKGDNPLVGDAVEAVYENDVIGVYNGAKFVGVGKAVDFLHSPNGFFFCVVLPSFLLVAYYAVNFVVVLRKGKSEINKEKLTEEEREKIRKEVMTELSAKENK